MDPFKRKHVVIGLVVALILFLFYRNGIEEYSDEYQGSQSTNQSRSSNRSYSREKIYTSQPSGSQSTINRKEVLRTNVKGYREATYWGSEHPIDEKIRYQDDEEFDRFIDEEIKSKDADVYWGAEY